MASEATALDVEKHRDDDATAAAAGRAKAAGAAGAWAALRRSIETEERASDMM